MTQRTRAVTPLFATAALAASLALSGCMGNPIESAIKQGAEQAIKGQTGVDVKVDEDTVNSGGKTKPKDFPSAVPIVDGPVLQGGAVTLNDVKTWTVSVKGTSVEESFKQADSKLTDAGFTAGMSAVGEAGGSGFYEGNGYNVILAVTKESGEVRVAYVVSATG